MSSPLQKNDSLVFNALVEETSRQQNQIELIASENIVSQGVLDALGHRMTNKTLEGYPGKRFHGGAEFVDVVEQAAIDRAKKLFDCDYANVQPHSGTQANQAVFFAALKPGDKVLSLDLAAGGHLSHGAGPNLSGRWFDAHHYLVEEDSGRIDYDKLADQANQIKPDLLIAGGSAYPRTIDFERMSVIARNTGALFLVDMAHIAGLVAGGVHPSPLPWADIVTCTTTKTLRGPRGGLILSKDVAWAKKLQSSIFPGVQGSMHTNVIAAKAVCLGEALTDDFRRYTKQVIDNAKVLGKVLTGSGIRLVSGGTDTHLLLLDFSESSLSGQQVQDALAQVNITSNKNPVPFDVRNPNQWVGLRLGTAAMTTRGLGVEETKQIGQVIRQIVTALEHNNLPMVLVEAQSTITNLCKKFPA